MKLFDFNTRRTRSGAVFSEFKISAIENPTFNLAEAVRIAHEQPTEEDDPALARPPPDASAVEFWRAAAASESQTAANNASLLECHPPGGDTSVTPSPRRPEPQPAPAVSSARKRSFSGDDCATGKKRNVRIHKKRRNKRDAEAGTHGHHATRPEVIAAHVKGARPFKTDLKAEKLPATSCGYAAQSKRSGEGVRFESLTKLLDSGYRLIGWNALISQPIVCSEGRIFAVLAGQITGDPTYQESCRLAYEAIMAEGRNASFSQAETRHRRGDFPAVNVGVTMGLGATYPMNLCPRAHMDMLSRLLRNEHIVRLANFADSAFNLWAPRVHRHYRDHLNPLFDRLSYLRRIFPRCVFPAAAFNFGGDVCTKSHRDCMNSAIGWCAIFGLGPYDPKKGGHLVLPDLRLVIEFPPGALIMIPSATLTHANLPVQEGDSRVSFTLYCGGGLLRYVDNGYRTEAQLRKKDPPEYARMCDLKPMWWQEDLKMYEFLQDHVSAVQDAGEEIASST